MKFDFHIHSTYSDGSNTVEEIFGEAKKRKVKALSITDHDSILGLSEVNELSKKYSIPYIPGVEFTAIENGVKFHILAYDIDINSLELKKYSDELLDFLNAKSLKQIEILQRNGIEIETDEYFKQSKGGPLYRAKLLKTLSNNGYIEEKEIMNSISKFFGKEGLCYTEEEYQYYDFESMCKLIKRNNGKIVLAHPGKIKKKDNKLYNELINSNYLDGVEIYHLSNNNDVREELKRIAERKKILVTGGSDYHGAYNKKKTPLCGVEIPQYVYENLYPYLRNKN